MPETGVEYIDHAKILSFEEIIKACELFVRLGINKVKITGGEPLVRKDCLKLIRAVKNMDGIKEVTLTTNGLLLNETVLSELKDIHIDGINISLDAVDREKYQKITRFDKVGDVINSIYTASAMGIKTKINSLIIPGVNDDQILPLVSMIKDYKLILRFIEVMPIGIGSLCQRYSQYQIMGVIENAHGKLTKYDNKLGNGPASYFSLTDHRGKIGFISAISHKFCHDCNRIRLTSTGFLKPCLHHDYGVELKQLLREGNDDKILAAMNFVIRNKPQEHQFEDISFSKGLYKTFDCGSLNSEKWLEEFIRTAEDRTAEHKFKGMSSIGG